MIYVIAGSHSEFRSFLRENDMTEDEASYVSGFKCLLGLRNIKYIKYGKWYERCDIKAIEMELEMINGTES